MTSRELTESCGPDVERGGLCVVVAGGRDGGLRDCLVAIAADADGDVPIVVVSTAADQIPSESLAGIEALWFTAPEQLQTAPEEDPATAAVANAISCLWPADVVLLSEPCLLGRGSLERLREAASANTNHASVSALTEHGGKLALLDTEDPDPGLKFATVGDPQEALHPSLNAMVGPCVYIRRDALELVGSLDTTLALEWALLDLSQRCLLAGLGHVAADEVVARRLTSARQVSPEPPAELLERYAHLRPQRSGEPVSEAEPVPGAAIAASGELAHSLARKRGPRQRVSVTIDARGIGASMTGTHRYMLELASALATHRTLSLRFLVSEDSDWAGLDLLRGLPNASLLFSGEIGPGTPRSAIFHRPQQVANASDLQLALRLGERFVLSQLDLIAYRNPSYHGNVSAWREYRQASRQALAAADRVAVFSQHTRDELVADALVDARDIRVIPPGLDHLTRDGHDRAGGLDAPSPTPSKLEKVGEQFLLCLGADYRHKNRPFALRLLSEMRERHGWGGSLVLAGAHVTDGSSREEERGFMEGHPELHGSVLDLGSVGETERKWLMGHATALVYPSVYEGFGLVPLEAGVSGVPCMFAAHSSLGEILPSELATIVPWNARESADRGYPLLSQGAKRTEHVEKLAATARGLSWAAAGEAMLRLYEETVTAPTQPAALLGRETMRLARELQERTAAHDLLVERLVAEREHARSEYDEAWRAYDKLKTEVGVGLGLVGPRGVLPEDMQRALLALGNHPRLRAPLLVSAAGAFRAARAIRRSIRRSS